MDQVLPARHPALADPLLGYVVATTRDTPPDALDVELERCEPDEEHIDLMSFFGSREKRPGDRRSAEGGFEGVVAVLKNCSLQLPFAAFPSAAISVLVV